ncbi:MAG: four helix bundle protein [Flavobacteriales bacterium]|nr:MAG: four helix bundle protein [Flavobacteriales bacterium]
MVQAGPSGGGKPNDLGDRLTVFAARVVVYVDRMPRTLAGAYYAGQLLRSGGSPALHYGEAQGAESVSDFIHKCKIALKELKESLVNLRIQSLSQLMPPDDVDLLWLLDECDQLIRIVGKIISNSQRGGR